MRNRQRGEHDNAVQDAVAGKAKTQKTYPQKVDESDCGLQIQQAAKARHESAVHASEGGVTHIAARKLDDGSHTHNQDRPRNEPMRLVENIHGIFWDS